MDNKRKITKSQKLSDDEKEKNSVKLKWEKKLNKIKIMNLSMF